ncbi:MAG: hypothetical protein CG437_889 [Methanosaeta sp. NSP1]|nr:MAG: hypothetical protein CG437_889 [Methanosaeta sp. NSP1]
MDILFRPHEDDYVVRGKHQINIWIIQCIHAPVNRQGLDAEILQSQIHKRSSCGR